MSQFSILIVDDQAENLNVMKQVLVSEGYRILFAKSGLDALKVTKAQKPNLILLDIMMPDLDGYSVCQKLKEDPELEHIPVIFVTAMCDVEDEKRGFSVGAVDYIEKPINPAIVRARVKTHLSLVSTKELEQTRNLIIQHLGRAAEYKDNETGYHIIRMSQYSSLIAQKLGQPAAWCENLKNAAPMHDIGKIGIPDAILLKPGPLDPQEWEIMKGHPEIGANIIGEHNSEILTMARTVALTHHEKWDGSGYPQGLKETDIPLEGRIVAVADVFDALTTARPYKKAWPVEEAIQHLQAQSGIHFQPELVTIFIELLAEVEIIKAKWAEK